MNDIFNIRRFGKYLLSDIKQGIGSYGVTLLSAGLAGVAINLVLLIYGLIFGVYSAPDITFREGFFVALGAVISIVIPVRYYGAITDRRKGADFILTPASTLEKYISMILMAVVIIPLAYSVIFMGADALWGLFDKTYDTSLLASMSGKGNLVIEDAGLSLNSFSAADDIAYIILTFLLGGLCFKKSKIGKTFLVIIAIVFVLGGVLGGIFLNSGINETNLVVGIDRAGAWDTALDLTILTCLLVAIYFRIRKIQL